MILMENQKKKQLNKKSKKRAKMKMFHEVLAPDLSKSINSVEINSVNIKWVTFWDNFPVSLVYKDAM